MVHEHVDPTHFGHRTLGILIYGHEIRMGVHIWSLDVPADSEGLLKGWGAEAMTVV